MTSIRTAKKLQKKMPVVCAQAMETLKMILDPQISKGHLEYIGIDEDLHGIEGIITNMDKRLGVGMLPCSDFTFQKNICNELFFDRTYSIPTSWLKPVPEIN